jgi:SynChlorMet cassette radical SAM/SPASM protein ScmF
MDTCIVPNTDFASDVALDLPEGVPTLHAFYLYMSTGCNLKCRHCWINPTFVKGNPSPSDVIDISLLRKAVDEAKPLGLCSVKLTGGEPMLHPQFIDIVDMLSSHELGLDMETNGTLLTADLASHLKEETNVNFISISIDGADAKTHDDFRGVQGAFEASSRGLRHLVDAGYKNVQVIMCVHRNNVDQIDDLVSLAVEYGAGSVKLSPVDDVGRGSIMHQRGEALDFENTMNLAQYVYGELQEKSPIRVILNLPPALMSIPELIKRNVCRSDCNVRHILGLLGTNDIALCGIGRTDSDLIYGRLGKDSIRDIWFYHPRILELRQRLDDFDSFPEICRECVHLRSCLTGCVAKNYVDSGKLIWSNRMCQEAELRGKFPRTRKRIINQGN